MKKDNKLSVGKSLKINQLFLNVAIKIHPFGIKLLNFLPSLLFQKGYEVSFLCRILLFDNADGLHQSLWLFLFSLKQPSFILLSQISFSILKQWVFWGFLHGNYYEVNTKKCLIKSIFAVKTVTLCVFVVFLLVLFIIHVFSSLLCTG